MGPQRVIQPLNVQRLREDFVTAEPFPHIKIDGFLDPDVARAAAEAFPTFEEARRRGFGFDFVNEKRKVQVTDPALFPDAVRQVHEAISSQWFLDQLVDITSIPKLLADEELRGGGMHVTGAQGRLDVHVDFNFIEARALHRRLNILVYLNPIWEDAWGGHVELWDDAVQHCHHSFRPTFNRCVIFETSEHSFHGVAAVTCPPSEARKSFAAYYYTKDPPADWDGRKHSTIFKARPDERLKGMVLMPAEKLQKQLYLQMRRVRRSIRSALGRGSDE